MAALIYRCRIDPDCEPATGPGFCPRHPTAKLEPFRTVVAPPSDQGGAGEATAAAGDGSRAGMGTAAGHGPAGGEDPSQAGPRPTLCLRLLGRTVAIPREGIVIGRDAPQFADLQGMADLLQVSRRHARLQYHEDGLLVIDLDSVNGTFVRGRRVRAPELIRPGEPLRLGQDVVVEVELVRVDAYGLPE